MQHEIDIKAGCSTYKEILYKFSMKILYGVVLIYFGKFGCNNYFSGYFQDKIHLFVSLFLFWVLKLMNKKMIYKENAIID